MGLTRRQLLLAACAPATAAAADAPLVVLVDSSVQMPQALIHDGQVVDGLQHDIAVEIGQRLGRPLRFRVVPRRRVGPLLLAGEEADLICTYLPAWLPGPLQWSRPFLEDGELLVTARRGPAPLRLRDVAGQRIGTIAGFEYTEVAAALGKGFLRDDGPNLQSLLRKLALGRVDHALVGRASFEYLLRRGEVPVALHPPLVVAQWRTACALSPHAPLALADLDAALAALQADGGLARIVDRYR
ncbi:ABC-type amino acid transport substrate-binding protein [Pelomonas saccharophila]|uniref:ABC-type amino acid transport substrate-binding protein n=1 Tax=Roseateles saccharophilus TaxID=304 RepID=A0ABU1YNY5_ROSSA|nr:transporter substrate-binding domain-containing protein [Roseateles saccharophilus]MDR7269696.1 ABC-type amino acid transport substrate-binding protein [Roseateles saccharophilus]